MNHWLFSFYLIALCFELLSILVFFIFFSPYKNIYFRHFPFIQLFLFIYTVLDMYLLYRNTNTPGMSMELRAWIIRIMYLAIGGFIIFRFLFLHSLIPVKNVRIKTRILSLLSVVFCLNVISPYFMDYQTLRPLPGYHINIWINQAMMLYIFVSIIQYIKKVTNQPIRVLLILWLTLIAVNIPFILLTNFSFVFRFPFMAFIDWGSSPTASLFYVIGGLALVIFANVIFVLFARKHIVIRTNVMDINYSPSAYKLGENSLFQNFLNQNGVSEREKDLIYLIMDGRNNREICEKLFISEATVKTHISNIFRKLNVKNRVELISILNKQLII